jgi:heme exporter protein D
VVVNSLQQVKGSRARLLSEVNQQLKGEARMEKEIN